MGFISKVKSFLTEEKLSKHNICSWLCILYALIIVAIGVSLPLTLGWDFEGSSVALDDYLVFYIVLYIIGICYFIFYHTVAHTVPIMLVRVKAKIMKIHKSLSKKVLASVSAIELVQQGRNSSTDDIVDNNNEQVVAAEKMSSGQFGLKIGVKASVAVFVIMICMELSTFIHQKISGINCQVDPRGIYVVFQLVYVVLQTFYVLNVEQEHVESYWIINHFGITHLIATTICTGIFLTAYDCLSKVSMLPQHLSGRENFSSFDNLPGWMVKQLQRPKTDNESDESPCSVKSYINEIHNNVKPFTFTFTMFFVYCCCILLILLYMHLRKKLYKSNTQSFFFKIFKTKLATFSSGAGLSLIVVSIIISILTLNANDNVYVAVFLIFLHTQASAAGLLALCRIARFPCTRHISPSKYTTIYLLFYFFVVLSTCFHIIGAVTGLEEDESTNLIVLEVLTEVVDLLQAFLHGLLILVGFTVDISDTIIEEKKMPREILIHLAATNFSALISGVFNSKAVLFKSVSKMIKRSEANEIDSTIAWSVLGSILRPCEEFNRFHTIIYLIKLYKTWTHHNHSL